jgi:WD40 repeat protein
MIFERFQGFLWIFSYSLSLSLVCFRYLSVENCVYEYDLRKVTSPIVNQPTRDLSAILQNQDEVNQLALAYHTPKPPPSKGKRKNNSNKRIIAQPTLYIAASDDAGTLRFMDASSTTSSQVLRHDPNAVVPSCAFRPSTQKGTLELASGGTDCKVLLWDVFKPK